jgi:hypothetical protein
VLPGFRHGGDASRRDDGQHGDRQRRKELRSDRVAKQQLAGRFA